MNKQDVATVIKAIRPYIRIDKDAMISALLTSPIEDMPDELSSLTENALLAFAWRDIDNDSAGILPDWVRATITQITHKKSSSKNPTWYCQLQSDDDSIDGMTLYLGTSNGYANEAKEIYPSLGKMNIGDVVTDVEITVYVTKSDRFLEMQRIEPGGRFVYRYETDESRKDRVIRDNLALITDNTVFLDFETNGLDDSAEIVQVATKTFVGAEYKSYVKPQDAHKLMVKGKGNKSASDINGITPDMLEDAPTFDFVYNELKEILSGKTVVTYGDFDVRMLNQVCDRHNLPRIEFEHIDLKEVYSEYNGEVSGRGGYKWVSLQKAYDSIVDVPLHNFHDAMVDVEAMIAIVKELTKGVTAF